MATRMQQRRGTSAQWTTANPVLASGEIGFETDTNQLKIGDGVNSWGSLSYFIDETNLAGSLSDYVEVTSLGVADGVATLDSAGNVPSSQLGNVPEVDLTGYATEGYADQAEADANSYTDDLIGDPTVDGTSGNTIKDRIDSAVTNLIDSAPEVLNTLDELAAAINDDENFATTVTNAIAAKADASHTHLLADVTDVTASSAELNVLDGITATTVELNYTDGVTSNIQTQLNAKSPLAGSTSITTVGTVTNVTSPTADGSAGVRKITMSASAPSGGADGDVWMRYY